MITIDDMMRAGCTTQRGVRYWESEGLLGDVERTSGKQRRYTADQLERARIIAAAKFAGWELDDVRKMVENYDQETYDAVMTRLNMQINAAEVMMGNLPQPAPEWDL